VVYGVAIAAHRIGRPELRQSIAFFAWMGVRDGGAWSANAIHPGMSKRPPRADHPPPAPVRWGFLGHCLPEGGL